MIKQRFRTRRAVLSLVFLVVLLLIVFGGGGYLGLFSTVTLEEVERGPYTLVVRPHQGSYRKMRRVLKRELAELKLGPLEGSRCVTLEGELRRLPRRFDRGMIGFIADNDEPSATAPFEIVRIPSRQVLLATTSAHPSVSSFKTYRRLKKWFKTNAAQHRPGGPVLETYGKEGTVTVAIPLEPVAPAAP